jgi:hypothetical protein
MWPPVSRIGARQSHFWTARKLCPCSARKRDSNGTRSLAAAQRKSEVTRLQNLMKHEEALENVARNKACSAQEKAKKRSGEAMYPLRKK